MLLVSSRAALLIFVVVATVFQIASTQDIKGCNKVLIVNNQPAFKTMGQDARLTGDLFNLDSYGRFVNGQGLSTWGVNFPSVITSDEYRYGSSQTTSDMFFRGRVDNTKEIVENAYVSADRQYPRHLVWSLGYRKFHNRKGDQPYYEYTWYYGVQGATCSIPSTDGKIPDKIFTQEIVPK